jgi:glycosyltransferase involved in cell wall biosynthesis
MNVLHIINTLDIGGAERLLVDTLPIMKAKGINVRVLLLVASGSAFEQKLQTEGIDVMSVNLRFGLFDPRLILRLRRLMRGADVVHTHLFPTQYWAALANSIGGKCVLVTTEHSTSNTRAQHWLTSQLDTCIYGLYDGVICISEAVAHFMRKRTPHHVEIRCIDNGVVLPSVDALVEAKRSEVVEGLTDTDFVMLQVARFSDQKNQDCVIRSLKLLPDNVHAVFAGYGVRLDACKQLAESLGVSTRTHFLGMRSDIARLWSIADIGVMSSHWEGFGLAAVEGMAYAKPVVASNVPGLADVVKFDRLLFAPDNEQALANSVMCLYADTTERRRMGEMCWQRAQQYDINKMVDSYIEFYDELLNKKGKQTKR